LTRNNPKLIFYPGRHGLTRTDLMTRFWSEMTVLTRNNPKLIFYPGRHGLTRPDPVSSVLVGNDGFDPKLIFYPGRHGLTRIDPVSSVLVGNDGFDPKLIFYPSRHGLTRWTWFWWKNVIDSRKIYFWIFKLFLNFFGFL